MYTVEIDRDQWELLAELHRRALDLIKGYALIGPMSQGAAELFGMELETVLASEDVLKTIEDDIRRAELIKVAR